MGRHALRTPALLPVVERGRPVAGAERARIGRQILAAVNNEESLTSISERMGRSRSWVANILYEIGYTDPRARFRGPARVATGLAIAGEYHEGASVAELMERWGIKDRRTVIRLLAEWEIEARAKPRPSEDWRRENLPAHLIPEDPSALPSPEEWVLIWDYLTKRRTAGALITELVGETGLSYGTIQRGLAALKVQPRRKLSDA